MSKNEKKLPDEPRPSPALSFAVPARKKPQKVTELPQPIGPLKNSGEVSPDRKADPSPTPRIAPAQNQRILGRFHTELREDYKQRLADICHERKKKRIKPNTILDITEEAFALWFKKHST